MFYPEHIFINIIIKLPLERYWKYKKGKRETHQKKKAPLNLLTWSKSEQKHLLQYRKKKERDKNTKLCPPHSKVPPVNVLTQTRNCTRQEIKLYIKKLPSSSVKTVISLRLTKTESSYYIYHTESAISHQQREPVIKTIEAYCTDSVQLTRPFIS